MNARCLSFAAQTWLLVLCACSRLSDREISANECTSVIQMEDSVRLAHGTQSSIVDPAFFATVKAGYLLADRSDKSILLFKNTGEVARLRIDLGPAEGQILTIFGGGVFHDSVVVYDYNAGKLLVRSLADDGYREKRLSSSDRDLVRSIHIDEDGSVLQVHYPVVRHEGALYSLEAHQGAWSTRFGDEAPYYQALPSVFRGIALPRADYRFGTVAAALVGRPSVDIFDKSGTKRVRVNLRHRQIDSIVDFAEMLRANRGQAFVKAANADSVLVGSSLRALTRLALMGRNEVLTIYTTPAEDGQMRAPFDQLSWMSLVTLTDSDRAATMTRPIAVQGGVVGVDSSGLIYIVRRDQEEGRTWLFRARLKQVEDSCAI